MQPEQIIGQLLGTLVGRKRSRRSGMLGMAMGRRGRGSLLSGGTLLTAAGLVWGALESMQKSTVPTGNTGGTAPPAPPTGHAPRGVMGSTPGAGTVVPPPLPTTGQGAGASSGPPPLPTQPGDPPPLPSSANAPAGGDGPVADLLPLLHLAISAARADGELSAEEEAVIRERAAALGIASDVDRALGERSSLESLTGAFTSEAQRQAAYALAFGVIHGDGVVAPGERMYLTQLGRLLRLPAQDIETIERETLGEE